MLSYTGIALAVALPLVACLIVLFITFLRQRMSYRLASIDLDQARDKISKLEEKLAVFPDKWTRNDMGFGFSKVQVLHSYQGLNHFATLYLEKWLIRDSHGLQITDSAARIESILFPSPRPTCKFRPEKDAALFPNPHSYTAAEIEAYLQRDDLRDDIAGHILHAVLLKAVTFEGSCQNSLLSFTPHGLEGIEKLHDLIEGVDLGELVRVYISKIGLYYRHPAGAHRKNLYVDLFESLFEPYYTSKTPIEVRQRQQEFDDVLDKAYEHGMKVLGFADGKFVHRWGPKNPVGIMFCPSLTVLEYEDGKVRYTTAVTRSEVGYQLAHFPVNV